jgi:hypothetical protein
MHELAADMGIQSVPCRKEWKDVPSGIPETYAWMKQFAGSEVNMGDGLGRAEGVVIRTYDRKKIAKLRFEDYEKTLGVRR